MLRSLAIENYELSLVLTDDAAIRILNRRFRSKDRATDVLSFPQFDSAADPSAYMPSHGADAADTVPIAVGDVVISVETAARQAIRMGLTLDARLRTLLIHGVLHLLGYDHERSRAEARRMFARERELGAMLAEVSVAKRRTPRSAHAISASQR